nr:MAG TPA: hypothetical protein [Caudoviricetes sp.]
MKRAWNIYKNYKTMFPTFRSALSKAWEVEKANVAKAIKDAEIAANTWVKDNSFTYNSNNHADSLTSYYANHRYNGD